jgi:hypothetical protein
MAPTPTLTRAAMPTAPLAAWTYRDAVDAVRAAAGARLAPADYNANERYLRGDHWQDGDAWIGPRGSDELWPTLKDQIARQFTPVGVVGEVLDRVANGLLKREADVTFAPLAPAGPDNTPSPEQQREADALSAAVSAWWDREKLWEQARQTVRRARALTRGVLRLAVAEGHLERQADGAMALPTDLDLDAAFRRVTLTTPAPETAALIADPRTLRPVAVVLFEVTEAGGLPRRWAELWSVGPLAAPAGPDAGAAPVPDDVAAQVHVRRLPENAPPKDFVLPVGVDRLTLAEVRGDLLITEAVRRQQMSLDYGSSLLNRTMETAGFKERYIGNAEPQGYWSEDNDGTAIEVRTFDDGVTRYKYAEPRTLGASVTTELIGVETGEDGARATPWVQVSEPTDPAFAIRAIQSRRADILHECRQAHVLANGEAVVSGYSRQQARADFENDLHGLRPALEGALRDVIEGAVALALAMTSDATLAEAGIGRDVLARCRAVVTCHVDAGPLAPDERAQTVAELQAGTLAPRTAMARLGVEDLDAELAAIGADPAAQLTQAEHLTRVLDGFAKSASWDVGVRYLHAKGVLSDAERTALLAQDTDGVPTDGARARRGWRRSRDAPPPRVQPRPGAVLGPAERVLPHPRCHPARRAERGRDRPRPPRRGRDAPLPLRRGLDGRPGADVHVYRLRVAHLPRGRPGAPGPGRPGAAPRAARALRRDPGARPCGGTRLRRGRRRHGARHGAGAGGARLVRRVPLGDDARGTRRRPRRGAGAARGGLAHRDVHARQHGPPPRDGGGGGRPRDRRRWDQPRRAHDPAAQHLGSGVGARRLRDARVRRRGAAHRGAGRRPADARVAERHPERRMIPGLGSAREVLGPLALVVGLVLAFWLALRLDARARRRGGRRR